MSKYIVVLLKWNIDHKESSKQPKLIYRAVYLGEEMMLLLGKG